MCQACRYKESYNYLHIMGTFDLPKNRGLDRTTFFELTKIILLDKNKNFCSSLNHRTTFCLKYKLSKTPKYPFYFVLKKYYLYLLSHLSLSLSYLSLYCLMSLPLYCLISLPFISLFTLSCLSPSTLSCSSLSLSTCFFLLHLCY